MPTPPSLPRRAVALIATAVAVTAIVGVSAGASDTIAGSPDAPADGFAGTAGDAGPRTARIVDLDVGPTLPGIDVSHWQGEIDWARVAGAGTRFAFLKATDGHDFLDPTYSTNRAGARSNGLAVGAYHFARPDASKGDAVEEARWFVSQADPRPGNLLPVLDLETSKGLDQQGVTLWARRWIAEVRRLTGVTPLVYTSPYGWMQRTGDSRALARDGAPLWIAHWGVDSPLLPAGDWDGRGWRVWQYTSSGHVPGIRGRVDLDVAPGNSLRPITIRRLTVEVSGDAGRVVSAPTGYGCRATCSGGADPGARITFTARPDERAYFTGWGGACGGDTPTCTVTARGNRTVTARFVTDITPPAAAIDAAAGFRGPIDVVFDEAVRRAEPGNVFVRRAGGERVEVARSCRSARGGAVACGGLLRSISLAPREPLVPGRRYQVVVNPAGARPVVDRVGNPAPPSVAAFDGPRTVEQAHAPVRLAPGRAWQVARDARASGGSFALSARRGASASMRFDGVGVDWVTVTGPNRGRARIWIDGEVVRVVDLHAASRTFGVVERVAGLGDGPHRLRIEVLGSAGPRGRWVAIDRFDVLA